MTPNETPTISFSQLVSLLPKNITAAEKQKILLANDFIIEAHKDRKRPSGELYVQHDIAVADTLNRMSVDMLGTTSGLLHDSLLAHTGKRPSHLLAKFGEDVSSVVTSLDTLDPYEQRVRETPDERSIEIIRQAIMQIIENDPRVVFIRMADVLQDLRKASNLNPDDQRRIALEAKNIYGPLANRLGIWQIKWQLEDLAFRYLQPNQYHEIATYLNEKKSLRDESIDRSIRILQNELTKAKISAEVTGRPKHIYSIFKKMERKNVPFSEVYDVRAIRVILNTSDIHACYQVLGIVHNLWLPISQEFDDYIARAKPNGYQSLHTAVIDSDGHTLEVQIRTKQMHQDAENGLAAHWSYKEGGKSTENLNKRIQKLRNLLAHNEDGEDKTTAGLTLLEEIGERIYTFTPKGKAVDLPKGSTPIDFAYYIHTEVGNRCRGAKINGKMVRLDHKLKNGDTVEILTASRGGPSRDWMNESLGYTGSARTRSRIRRWFRLQEREKNIQQGRDVVTRELKRLGLTDVFTVEDIATALKENVVDDFLTKVGFGDIQANQVSGAIAIMRSKLRADDELLPLLTPRTKRVGLTVRGVAGLHTRMAQCCNPVPPEEITGFITRGRGVTVHRTNCHTVRMTSEPERLIDVSWGEESEVYPIPFVLQAFNRPGLMNDITNVLKGRGINLTKTKAKIVNSVATIYLVAEVTDLVELDWLLRKLEQLPNVIEVRRQRWAE